MVLVTGGSKGIGVALVQGFLDAGDSVATCSRTATAQTDEWTAKFGERFLFHPADLADRSSCADMVHAVVERFGRIDVLVNNAGVAFDGVVGLLADEEVDAVIDVNLRGTFAVTKLVVRRMLMGGPGRIINISSVSGITGYRG